MEDIKKIYFFVSGSRNLGSSRVRAYMISDRLGGYGIESSVRRVTTRPWWNFSIDRFRDFYENFKILLSVRKKKDVIFLQKTIAQLDFIFLILFFRFFFGKGYFFDFDDAIFLNSRKIALKTSFLCKYAKGVVVGSRYLHDFAVKFNKNTILIPTSVDVLKYSVKKNKNKKIVLGWVGTAKAHYENLRILKPVFEELMKRNFNFEFVLIGAAKNQDVYNLFNSIEGLNISYVDQLDWSNPKNVIELIQNFDIGLMPLEDSEWNKGKCAFKAVEYMACGIPVIISNVGENKFLVKSGIDGFIVNNTSQWVDTILYLAKEEGKRIEIGLRGRGNIEKQYSYQENIPKLISFLNKNSFKRT